MTFRFQLLLAILLLCGFNSFAQKEVIRYSRAVSFIENQGQIDNEKLLYYSSAIGEIQFFQDHVVLMGETMEFPNMNIECSIGSSNMAKGQLNYFGQDKQLSNIPSYQTITYHNLWEGIDLAFTALPNNQLEFQFIVEPYAKIADIKLNIKGGKTSLDKSEDALVLVKNNFPLVKISSLKAYQGIKEVAVEPLIEESNEGTCLSYEVGEYDEQYALVIDPVVFIMASSGTDYAYDVALGIYGDVYVVGQTGSTNSFVAADDTFGISTGSSDAFVCRYDQSMSTLLSTTIIASSNSDEALGVTVDTSTGNVFVVGTTKNASDFSVSPNIWGTPSVNERNGFVCKFNSTMEFLHKTTIICSNQKDEAHDVTIGPNSDVFVTGQAGDDNSFACSGCSEKVKIGDNNGNVEAFVTKLSNDLNTHLKTVLLTSEDEDESYKVQIDQNSQVFIAGRTKNYDDFADSKEYYGGQPAIKVGYSAFVARFNYNLDLQKTGILASELVSDVIRAMIIDHNGNVFVGGLTEDANSFPKNPKYWYGSSTFPQGFVVRLNNSLSNHGATAILTSSQKDKVYDLALDANQNIIVGGYSMNPTNFANNRTLHGPIGSEDGFITVLSNDLSNHLSTDIYSGNNVDVIYGIAYGADGGIYAVGETEDAPNLTNYTNTVYGTSGGTDAFIIKAGGIITNTERMDEEAQSAFAKVIGNGDGLSLKLKDAAYIGYELYSIDGKLMDMQSFGFRPSGEHRFSLPKRAKGIYLLKVRAGEKVETLKFFQQD